MPGEDAIRVQGEVTDVISPRLFRVRFANGHEVLAHPAKRDADRARRLVAGTKVELEMSPFDMSNGRLKFLNEL